MNNKHIYATILFLFVQISLSVLSLNAQTWPADTIHAEINTGNPRFPFPQFNEYTAGKSLALYNAEGVTHADMEKAMKEGYKIMMHRTLKTSRVYNGKTYLVYNHGNVPANYGTFVSEGDGYALLAAAYFADKETFDGLWLWIHDNRLSKVKKYYDCSDLRPTYPHGPGMPGWDNDDTSPADATNINSATDGDLDIAMGLVLAYTQWGDYMGINDACGNPISYKEEALKMVSALVDTVHYTNTANGAQAGTKGYLSGDIGIDGYVKNGNTWDEITGWRYSAANTAYPWAVPKPDPLQVRTLFTDYIGPAYFNQFAKFLQANGGSPWDISQFLRAEASSDWMIKQMYDKGYIASSGNCTISDDGSVTTFSQHPSGPAGEDFRLAWRTMLNYVWHGNPTTQWDPVAHQVVPGANTYEYDMAVRHASFLKYPRTNPTPGNVGSAHCSVLGASPDPSCPTWKGVVQIKQAHLVTGAVGSGDYRTNYNVGSGSPAAVASGDIDLVAEIYRQSEILWDDASALSSGMTDAQRYEQSTPKYFHDWFRLLGMLTASGNLHPPTSMEPAANMKVYMAVDKTFVYEGDLITYTVSYRNYGSIAATGVSISTVLDSDYEFISASNGGTLAGNTITWNIGDVPGFQTATGIPPTQGTRTFVVRVRPAPVHERVCLTSTITASNSPSWTSNEFPNNATYTMERNCVDLLRDRVLVIEKTTDRSVMNPGDIVNFKLDFENRSGSNLWLNGGRDRVIVSYGNHHPTNGTSFYQFYRIWHTAHEAYINLHNYRVSYFMNDAAAIGQYNAATNPTGWDTYVDNQNDLNKYGYNPLTLPANERLKFSYEKIPWGSDANGSWNQRIVTQFANVLTAPSTHIYDKLDSDYLIHKGVKGPGFIRTRFESKPSSNLANRLVDDWSYSAAADVNNLDGQALRFFPVSPTFTNFATGFAPVVVNNYSKDICNADVPNFTKVLVEEFDGYTWRRIAGNGPLPGRETYNVVVTDSIPIELMFSAFTDDLAVGVTATYTPLVGNPKFSGYIKWTVPVMLTGEKADLSYKAIANTTCPAPDINFINAGWIWSDVDSPDSSAVPLRITCNPVPPTPPVETSLDKTADKDIVDVGDVVTYTLTFTNNDGSTVQWGGTGTTVSDWQTVGSGTNLPDLNNAIISFDQNANNPGGFPQGASGYSFGHKKAHGKNGYVEATIDKQNASNFSFIYRYQSGTPGQANFVGLRLEVVPVLDNVIEFRLYNNATLLANLTSIAYGGSSDPFNIKTELIDDKLYIWINDYTGAPLKVISGITQETAGYTGVHASNSQQVMTAYKAHFDSSFDLVIRDEVPSELNNITNISNGGTLTGSTITWPTIAGPILATDPPVIRTFQATVNTCADFITNIGEASVYGIGNILSQYVVTCNNVVAPVELVFFNGQRERENILLKWATASEYNSDRFEIERSLDGIHFERIAILNSAGNSNTIINYQYNDMDAPNQRLYYRLVQVDQDGTTVFSKVIVIEYTQEIRARIFPNPFSGTTSLSVISPVLSKIKVKITTANGKEVYNAEHFTNEEIVLGDHFASGLYFVQLSDGLTVKVIKISKEE